MPEEHPLKTFIAFPFVLETKFVVLVRKLQQVEDFSTSLVDCEWWRSCVVNNDRYTAWSVSVATREVKDVPFGFNLRNHSSF